MGQRAVACCGEGVAANTDLPLLRATPGTTRARPVASAAARSEAERLLAGCPRELADSLRQTGHWSALRCRPWLSANALRGLHRSLQQCQLLKLAERHREVETPEECTYECPPVISWSDLDLDHIVSAGQVFRREDASKDKLWHFRRIGLQALRQGKVGVVVLAGGANLRLPGVDPPAGCSKKVLGLQSGKSILQLCCERLRRIVSVCRGQEEGPKAASSTQPSIPVFVMTSQLTHRTVVDHFEAHRHFGLLPRDIFFFQQPLLPIITADGQLLPQSLGGEFAHAPGGQGQMLAALASSSALEQMRDRGIDCVHVLGIDNALARVCDPVYVGFCREVDVDCACKTVGREGYDDDLELFCLRQNAVRTQYADIEEMACGLDPADAPEALLAQKSSDGVTSVGGSISSFYMSVAYIEEVVARPVCMHRVSRAVPYLDFHLAEIDGSLGGSGLPLAAAAAGGVGSAPHMALGEEAPVMEKLRTRVPMPVLGVQPYSWPAEKAAPNLACQRALQAAAGEVIASRGMERGADCREVVSNEAWRCEVHLDAIGPSATVRVRSAVRGPSTLEQSLLHPHYDRGLPRDEQMLPPLRCSLVVPTQPNAYVLETSVLDYFMFTDRAVAFEVDRRTEFAPVRELRGSYSAERARTALHELHCSWIFAAGGLLPHSGGKDALVEVSPLLSYEGEGLATTVGNGCPIKLPAHITGPEEEEAAALVDDETNVDENTMDGLDTRFFYFQEYPQRLEMSTSHVPQFRHTHSLLPLAPSTLSRASTDLGVSPPVFSR